MRRRQYVSTLDRKRETKSAWDREVPYDIDCL